MPSPTLDPYAPVERVRLMAHDAMRSAAHSVRVADPDAPSGFREAGVVSPTYMLAPNRDVRDLAYAVAERSNLGFTHERTQYDGKRFDLFLVARDRNLVEVLPGDDIGLGLRFSNSYDGSQRLSASLFVYRLVCKNGLCVPTLFRQVAFKHTPAGAHWEEEIDRAMSVLSSAPAGLAQFAQAARVLASMRVTAGRLRDLRAGPLAGLPLTTWARTVDRFLEHESLDGWGLANAVTNVLWHAERPTASDLSHNEAAMTGLVQYAAGEAALVRRN